MKKIECFVQPFDFEEVAEGLVAAGVEGMSVFEAKGFGVQRGMQRGVTPKRGQFAFHPKTKIEIVVSDADVDRIVETIKTSIRVKNIGEGKIFVSAVEDALRARTGEHGEAAIH
jgi:nitrogen regulatory protein P-II 1